MSEKDLRENPFRDEIFDYFLANGYKESKKSDYDFNSALDIAKLFDFLESTQGDELAKFKETYKDSYKQKYVDLLCKKIETRGLLTALNEWVEDYSSNTKFNLVYFKTGLTAMSGNLDLYDKNIFSIRREFSYEDKIDSYRVDLALFLNGIPITMIELKKQTAGQKAGFEGTKQFRTTRNPDELVFSFNKRTLAYFAVDEMLAFVTARLDKQETKFLPFNKGTESEGAGNPIVAGKHSTAYLWEEILQKDMLLRIIREFMFIDDEGEMIFPRYHQLRAVLNCENDVNKNGIGGRYLIWHSAGSGKTKTIAWLAKRLINNPDINTVIVISDRTVIDGQLGDELKSVDGKKGVAKHISTTSADLLKSLEEGGFIIVTTLQKFRPILDKIKSLNAQKGLSARQYAVIIDEAHSSTSGKAMSKASETLTGKSLKEAIEIDNSYEELEDGQNQLLKNSAMIDSLNNVSYFAFTATPKPETIELFGTRNSHGKTYFDKYSMKQAIEEQFILNPIACYTTYSDRLKIKQTKEDDTEHDSVRTHAAILNYVTTLDEVIDPKTQIILDDFIENRSMWLNGNAKAMIITPSRMHAVRYRIAVDKYLRKRGCSFRACVAFTGTIELDGAKYTEEIMNRDYIEKGIPYDIKSIIKNNDDLRIIIVADKLQAGFDENKLCIMYIDKMLGSSVKAVQTISRINRPAKNKRTFVLDFVNSIDKIKEYFTQFYGGELFLPTENEIDPNILFVKRDIIFDYFVITQHDVQKIYDLIIDKNRNSAEITNIFSRIKLKFDGLPKDRQKLFTAEIKKFPKLFYYISAVYNKWNNEMEKLAVVFDVLYNVVFEPDNTQTINPEDYIELIAFSTQRTQEESAIEIIPGEYVAEAVSTYVTAKDKSRSLLNEIIERFNLRYAHAEEELAEIVTELSNDSALVSNVRDSSPNAYESVIFERVTASITKGLLNGTINGDNEKASFYAELSSNKNAIKEIRDSVVREIRELLLAG